MKIGIYFLFIFSFYFDFYYHFFLYNIRDSSRAKTKKKKKLSGYGSDGSVVIGNDVTTDGVIIIVACLAFLLSNHPLVSFVSCKIISSVVSCLGSKVVALLSFS